MNLSILFAAIMMVESGGDVNAVGDGGRSLGPYQIGRAYWTDARQFDKTLPSYERGVKDSLTCRRAMRAYWLRYCPEALNRGDFETLARVHNGGPNGMRVKATKGYWKRVKAELKKSEKK